MNEIERKTMELPLHLGALDLTALEVQLSFEPLGGSMVDEGTVY